MRNFCFSFVENVKGRNPSFFFFFGEWLHVKKIQNANLSLKCEHVQYINMSSGAPLNMKSELGFPKTWKIADQLCVWPSRTLYFVVRAKTNKNTFGS